MSVIAPLIRFAAESAGHAAPAGHAAEESAGIAALGLDPLAILAQAGTFLVLFWIVKKFALSHIARTLEVRRKTIDNGVRLGQKMEAEHAKLEGQVEAQLRAARGDADKILADAHKEAGAVVQAAEAQAAKKVEQLIADAHVRIADDMQKARQALEKDIRVLVADATATIIEEKLDEHKDDALIRRALSGARK